MSGDFPTDILAKRKLLLDRVEQIGVTPHEPGAKSEGLATLAPEAAKALRESGMFRLKLCTELGVPRPISPTRAPFRRRHLGGHGHLSFCG